MIDTKEFVRELIRYGVEWDEESHNHWTGIKVVTNTDMRTMCSKKYGREYDLLTNGEQRVVRESVFNKIRYGISYE